MAKRKVRVLVIEDSSFNRRSLVEIISADPELEVVAAAADGEEGLRAALAHRPEVITLDLQMPRVDGFTFLRLLMAKAPTPVVVISSFSRRADVFRALELGAIDFIAKPNQPLTASNPAAADLLAKIKSVRHLGHGALRPRRSVLEASPPAERLAVIGASTGGPPAVAQLLAALPADLPLAVLVAQHMPERFTRAFAERLNRIGSFEVEEARDGQELAPGRALVAPGGKNLVLRRGANGLHVRVTEPAPGDKCLPSIDLLFQSAAAHASARGMATVGVVLTGMGSDGSAGVVELKAAGGLTLAESEESAVIFGMPQEAIATGAIDRVLDLDGIVDALVRFGREGR